MEYWSIGVLECWSNGVMECWSVGFRRIAIYLILEGGIFQEGVGVLRLGHKLRK